MPGAVPEGAWRLADRLAQACEQDRRLAVQLTEAQHRLEAANARLRSGLTPDALGRLYDDTSAAGAYEGGSVICGVMVEARAGRSPARCRRRCCPRCSRPTLELEDAPAA
ncbi:MAG: hypothetical protein JO130_13130 [Solirubrobacterales bacterium]|nr:hypothetical protein [Solirubrobacterales bacterium]